MTKVLITNCHIAHKLGCVYNRGSSAVMISTIVILRRYIPDAEFTAFVQLSEDFAEEYGIKVIRNKLFFSKHFSPRTMLKSSLNLVRCALWALLHKRFSPIAKALVNNRELSQYADADIVVDVSMDLYSDDFGFVSVVEHSKDILLGVFLKKPVVIWAQSLGPFKSKLTSWLVRFTLNRVVLITVREEISLGHLLELGIDSPTIYTTADPAFLLEAASEKRAREILSKEEIDASDRPLVGVTMSWTTLLSEAKKSRYLQYMESAYWAIRILLPEKLFELIVRQASRFKRFDSTRYVKVEVMSEVVDYLVENLNANVILIPHDKEPRLDDTILAREILQRAKQRKRVRLITGDYSAPELKAVIGQCDLFVGAKMHANIAALSMNVPTVAIQYSHKFYGIMRLLGQEPYICDNFTEEEVESRIDEAWYNREEIRAELDARIDDVKEGALYNAKLVAELLDSKRASNVSL